jgi:Tfp pilus assembly protein PilN
MIRINLLAEKRAGKARRGGSPTRSIRFEAGGWQGLVLVLIVLGALIFIGEEWWRRASKIEGQQDEKAQLEQRLQELQKDLDRVKELEEKQAAKERRVNLLKELKANKQVPVYVMQQINDCFGAINQGEIQSIWLELLSENQQKLTIGGRANTFNDVSELWNRLNESPVFENVTLGQTIKDSETIRFTLNTTIVPENIQIDIEASEPGAGRAPAPAA